MSALFDALEFERFRSFIRRRFGLSFEERRTEFLVDVLRQRMERTACNNFVTYEQRYLSTLVDLHEEQALAEHLTVCETYFFRYTDQFRALAEMAIPSVLSASRGRTALRILSAGCASGEEAYSLAILIREQFPEFAAWDITIHGIDINPTMLKKATRGLYGKWSLRSTSADIIAKYFHARGRDWLLHQSIRSMVTFEERNLIGEDAGFWQRDAFDIVFCRNVTMYFTPEATRSVIARIADSITAGGFLFLGHAETLRNISTEFRLQHVGDIFCYQRLDNPKMLTVATGDANKSWFEIIDHSSKHIRTVTESNNVLTASTLQALPACDQAAVHDLLRRERFAEALACLSTFPDDVRAEADARLLFAVLLMNTGDVAGAEQACRRLLKLNDRDADAHYVMALCCEHAGNDDASLESDKKAAGLDTAFAMPHLHMGLAAKRLQRLDVAEREFEQALELLDREEALRILLFGGGFTREALLEFCRMELLTCKT
jgi:chemotaxis protein methyltransferase CheR